MRNCTFTVATAAATDGMWLDSVGSFSVEVCAAAGQTVTMTWLDALKVGVAEAFPLIPGTSRSGATIIGGMLFGLSRHVATEFTFYLAIPTLGIASLYSLYKERELLALDDLGIWSAWWPRSFRRLHACAG